MNKLAVNFAGVDFKNPVIPASGTFGYGKEYEEFFDRKAPYGKSSPKNRRNTVGYAQQCWTSEPRR